MPAQRAAVFSVRSVSIFFFAVAFSAFSAPLR